MQRLGHTEFRTTQIYIREAEAVREGFGNPFPELPETLLGIGFHAGFRQRFRQKLPQLSVTIMEAPGIEPCD